MHKTNQLNSFGTNVPQCGAIRAERNGSGRRADCELRPAVTFPKGWQRERVQRLARICRCIDAGQARGKRMHEMLVNHAWRWRARQYKSDPARPIRFRYSTLLRLYYTWRKGGRIPDALALHYWRGRPKATMGQVVELSKLCLAPETSSFSAAYRKLQAPGATECAFRYAMPARLKGAVAKLLAHRRRGQALEREARKVLEALPKCK
jgi:hypothetical protein